MAGAAKRRPWGRASRHACGCAACKDEEGAARLRHGERLLDGKKVVHSERGLTSMRKIGSLSLTAGASIVAVTGGVFLVYAHDKSQVDKSQVVGKVATEAADAGSVRIPDRPDWNWD